MTYAQKRADRIEHVLDALAPSAETRYLEVVFEEPVRPVRIRRRRSEGNVEFAISLPLSVLEIKDDEQLDAVIRRVVASVLAESEAGVPALAELKVPAPEVKLNSMYVAPARGRGDRWASGADLNAFARAGRVIADLVDEFLQEHAVMSSWPFLELRPTAGLVAPELGGWGRYARVPLPKKFATLGRPEREKEVLRAFTGALALRLETDGMEASDLGEALARFVSSRGFSVSETTAPLRSPQTTELLQLEYRADVDGAAFRVIVRDKGQRTLSDWQPMATGLEGFVTLAPGQGYSWLPDGRAHVSSEGMSHPRFVFDPKDPDGTGNAAVATGSLDDPWSLIPPSHTIRDRALHLRELAVTLPLHLGQLNPDSLRSFGLWWAARHTELFTWALREAADIMIGDTSDDVFEDFRSWVILLGKDSYGRVIADTDAALSALGVVDEEEIASSAEVASAIAEVYRAVLDDDLPVSLSEEPSGPPIAGRRSERRTHYPKLSARYPLTPDTIRFPWREGEPS